jgi:hypothetical protein
VLSSITAESYTEITRVVSLRYLHGFVDRVYAYNTRGVNFFFKNWKLDRSSFLVNVYLLKKYRVY